MGAHQSFRWSRCAFRAEALAGSPLALPALFPVWAGEGSGAARGASLCRKFLCASWDACAMRLLGCGSVACPLRSSSASPLSASLL